MASARVLAATFAHHYPEGSCTILVVDDVKGALRADSAGTTRFITLNDLTIPDVEVMAGIYSPIEFSTAVKPWLLAWMLDQYGSAGPVAYFDPDIRVYSRFSELEEMLEANGIVLTPHVTTSNPLDGKAPSEQALLLAGVYNLGFIGLSESASARAMLTWWQHRLARDCIVDPPAGFFVDQRPMDFIPGLFDDVGILRHEGYNAAYWNMATRELIESPRGLRINDKEVRFVHFSGYDPRKPGVLSKHQNRVQLDPQSPWRYELDAYGQALLDAGYVDAMNTPYAFRAAASGVPLSPLLRAVYRMATGEGFSQSLFDEAGDAAFRELLLEEDQEWPGRSKFERFGWTVDTACRAAHPDPQGVDGASVRGRLLQGEIGQYLYVDQELADSHVALRARKSEDGVVDGVNLVGYLNAALGVGEVSRQMVRALDSVGMPVWPVSLSAPGDVNKIPFFTVGGSTAMPFQCSIFCVNADMTPLVVQELGHGPRPDGIRGGFWWWELDEFPAAFSDAFGHVDFVLAGSRFVADAIARSAPVPVFTVPVPVEVQPSSWGPKKANWRRMLEPPARFTFLFSFDYRSVARRKNPAAVISAFVREFEALEGARLIIKSMNHEEYPAEHASLKRIANGRSDIVFLQEFLTATERDDLVRQCDCYVSLHRSEGMGLTMAEAMYASKPVIATAYSGNMDFMDEANSLLVDYKLVPVGEDAGPYSQSSMWADPCVEHASTLMRQVFDDPGTARQIGERAAASIRRTHSLTACASALVAAIGMAWAGAPVPHE